MRFYGLSRDRSDVSVRENVLTCAQHVRETPAHYIPARRNEGILFSVEF